MRVPLASLSRLCRPLKGCHGPGSMGKVAELLLLDGAPLEGRPTHVVVAGEVVEL